MNKVKTERLKGQLPLHAMMLPGTLLLIIFCIVPMTGIWMAFSKYKPVYNEGYFSSLFKGEYVGLAFFRQIFSRPDFANVVWNTVYISFVKIFLLIVFGVVLALMLNEVVNKYFKKTIQTVVFIPYFLSWTILATVLIDILSVDGPINKVLGLFGVEPISFLASNKWFRSVLFVSECWKSLGYQAIYFLAAITGIDPGLYEAAKIDGAGKWKQCIHITLPCIVPTIILMSVLNLGNIMSAGFDQIVSLYNEMVYDTGDVIDTMAYRVGLVSPSTYQYSLGTAIGLFKSVISCAFFGIGYFIADKKFKYRIF